MEAWKLVWTGIYLGGLGAFALLAIAILPLGLRDLFQLLRDLKEVD